MTIKIDMIMNCLKNNNIKFEVVGDVVSANRLAAIGPDVIKKRLVFRTFSLYPDDNYGKFIFYIVGRR